MKILHVTKKYPNAIGGDAIYVANLENQQKISGNEVYILTPNCKEIIYKNNVFKFGLRDNAKNWDKIGIKRFVSLFIFLFYFLFILKRIKPDIIHVHAVELGFLVSLWSRIFKIPVVLTCLSLLFPYQDSGLFKRVVEFVFLKFGKFKKIITVDTQSLENLKKSKFKDYLFLPTGVDLHLFESKKVIKSDTEKIKFLFCGRLEKIKGLDYLITVT